MPNTIQLKRSSTASAVPQAGDLSAGELAVNSADGKLFLKKDDATIVEVGAGSGGASTPYEQSFVATASQTNFTLLNAPVAAWVWVNGAAQDASEWSISSNDIVLATPSTLDDTVEVYYLADAQTVALNVTYEKTLTQADELVVLTGVTRWYPTKDIEIVSITAAVGVAPIGDTIDVDVNKNGTSILASAVSIAASAYKSGATAPSSATTLTTTDYLTVDVDQIGSIIAGSNLTVSIKYKAI